MPENGLMPIGELARRAGVATSALRYYERIGLLTPAERVSQRRHYPPSSAERLALIRLYQDAGFTLAEIGRLVPATSRGRRAWDRLAKHKVAELDARIAAAQRAKKPDRARARMPAPRSPDLSQFPLCARGSPRAPAVAGAGRQPPQAATASPSRSWAVATVSVIEAQTIAGDERREQGRDQVS
ncbi:MAG: MerR family transcriptional regulator [Acidimicrobiia bacterium]